MEMIHEASARSRDAAMGVVGAAVFGIAAAGGHNLLFTGPTFAVTPAGQALCYVQTGTTPVSR